MCEQFKFRGFVLHLRPILERELLCEFIAWFFVFIKSVLEWNVMCEFSSRHCMFIEPILEWHILREFSSKYQLFLWPILEWHRVCGKPDTHSNAASINLYLGPILERLCVRKLRKRLLINSILERHLMCHQSNPSNGNLSYRSILERNCLCGLSVGRLGNISS